VDLYIVHKLSNCRERAQTNKKANKHKPQKAKHTQKHNNNQTKNNTRKQGKWTAAICRVWKRFLKEQVESGFPFASCGHVYSVMFPCFLCRCFRLMFAHQCIHGMNVPEIWTLLALASA